MAQGDWGESELKFVTSFLPWDVKRLWEWEAKSVNYFAPSASALSIPPSPSVIFVTAASVRHRASGPSVLSCRSYYQWLWINPSIAPASQVSSAPHHIELIDRILPTVPIVTAVPVRR